MGEGENLDTPDPPLGSATATWMSKFRYAWGRFARNFGKTTAQESKQIPPTVDMCRLKTLRFSPGSAWSSGVLSCPIVRANSGKVSLGDVTAHSRVQDWLRRERLGTRLPPDNKGNDVLSMTAKCREVTYHPVSSLSSFSFSFSLSSSRSSSSSSSTDWKSLDWKSASSARFYMENQGLKKASSHESVEYDRPGKQVSWHAGYQHTTMQRALIITTA